jgi:hypothetical protein
MVQQVVAEDDSKRRPTEGDIAILRFLSAVEQIESDLWQGRSSGQRDSRTSHRREYALR